MLSPNGQYLTYMGYAAPAGTFGVSNSYTTGAGTNLQPPVLPAYDRAVALISLNGSVVVTPLNNAYSGDNPLRRHYDGRQAAVPGRQRRFYHFQER